LDDVHVYIASLHVGLRESHGDVGEEGDVLESRLNLLFGGAVGQSL
jgi:hypothetical protein